MDRKIILASQSKQRYKALASLDLKFQVLPANIDEQAIKADSPSQRAELVAMAKASKVSQDNPQAIVIAGDTYGFFNNQFFEKPVSQDQAKEMLQALSGQEFEALTGFAYLDPLKNIKQQTVKVMKVSMRQLSDQEIDNYVSTQPVLTWSAAFSPAYDSGAVLIETLMGSYTAFTYGLPMEEVASYLRKSGVKF